VRIATCMVLALRVSYLDSAASADDAESRYVRRSGGRHDHEALWPVSIRARAAPWVVSPAVACLSGLKSAPRKRVRGNPPRVQIPPPPPADKAKRWPRHKVGAGVRGLGLIFGLIWLYFDRLFRCLGWTRAARRADSPRRCESEQRRVRSGLPSRSLTIQGSS
jgi:hypothetical protein